MQMQMIGEESMSDVLDGKAVLNNREEVELAKAAQRCIISCLDHSHAVSIAIVADGVDDLAGQPILRLPPHVLRLFADMLGTLAQGKAVAIMPKDLDLTTQEAATFLNVSRPHLVKLLEQGRIPFHKVGSHRRIRLEEVARYKEGRRQASKAALQALAEQAQELDMGY
jgi:excisionase family DNA binding protein